jgi:hypothetical protein
MISQSSSRGTPGEQRPYQACTFCREKPLPKGQSVSVRSARAVRQLPMCGMCCGGIPCGGGCVAGRAAPAAPGPPRRPPRAAAARPSRRRRPGRQPARPAAAALRWRPARFQTDCKVPSNFAEALTARPGQMQRRWCRARTHCPPGFRGKAPWRPLRMLRPVAVPPRQPRGRLSWLPHQRAPHPALQAALQDAAQLHLCRELTVPQHGRCYAAAATSFGA